MTSSYSRNISNLRERSRKNTNDRISRDRELTRIYNQRGQAEAAQIYKSLGQFSSTLNDYAEERIKDLKIEGKRIAREHAQADAERVYELAQQIESHKGDHTELTLMKEELLKLQGTSAYPEADRLTSLSGWQQVGYAQEKLRAWKETFPDKLAHAMQNSDKPITIQGITFTPKQLRDNNIQGLPFKEAAVKVLTADIRKAANLDMYSEEMLELAGVGDSVVKAQGELMSKYRKRYNIDSSFNTRNQWAKEWKGIPEGARTGKDLWRAILISGNTVDKNGQLLGNPGAWDFVMTQLKAEGIAKGDPEFATRMGLLEMPPELCKKLGVPLGTTFGYHWKGRFGTLKTEIQSGIATAVDQEKKILDAYGKNLGNDFQKEVMENGGIDNERLEWYKDQNVMLGGVLDARIKQYETALDRDEEKDREKIKDVMAANNGKITHTELNEFNPRAALDFRKDADRFEAALKKEYRVDHKIKSALNQSWTDAGLKDKEKSLEWQYAYSRALEDYDRKFNDLIRMGYPAKQASHLALNGAPGAVKNEEGAVIDDFEGVVAEIDRMGALSKYTQDSQRDIDALKDSEIRVFEIAKGKVEMLEDPRVINKKIIGGKYGEEQINSIIESIKLHGTWKGVREAEDALNYYDGLSRGKRGMWAYGLIDSQLKAAGHPGLWPERVSNDDPDGAVEANSEALQPTKYGGSINQYNTVINDSQDLINYYMQKPSIYNEKENLAEWLGGTD